MAIKEGSFVKVEYTGSFDDGTVFDSSKKHGQPLQFQVGMKQMIPGFEKAVIGMGVGEEKEVILKPEEAYGQVNEQLIQKAPRDKVPSEIKVGMVLGMNLPDGKQIPSRGPEHLQRLPIQKQSIDVHFQAYEAPSYQQIPSFHSEQSTKPHPEAQQGISQFERTTHQILCT